MIFRKLITRRVSKVIAIEADSINEASDIFKDWISDCENSSDLDMSFNDSSDEYMEDSCWIHSFDNVDEYNRNLGPCDYTLIEKPESSKTDEPLYDLHFMYSDSDCHATETFWADIPMSDVIEHVKEFNKDYFLTPSHNASLYGDIKNAIKRGVTTIAYDLKRRNEKDV